MSGMAGYASRRKAEDGIAVLDKRPVRGVQAGHDTVRARRHLDHRVPDLQHADDVIRPDALARRQNRAHDADARRRHLPRRAWLTSHGRHSNGDGVQTLRTLEPSPADDNAELAQTLSLERLGQLGKLLLGELHDGRILTHAVKA